MGKYAANKATEPGLPEDPMSGPANIGHALALLGKKVFDFVFPEEEGCVLCGRVTDLRHAEEIFAALICHGCLSRIPFVQAPICQVCGRPLRGRRGDVGLPEHSKAGVDISSTQDVTPDTSLRMSQRQVEGVRIDTPGASGPTEVSDKVVCRDCDIEGRFFLRARAVGTYDGALKEIIREFKFYGRRDLAEGLGVLMAREAYREKSMRTCDIIVPVPLHPLRLAERGYNQAELLAKEVGACLGIRVQDSVERTVGPGEQNKVGRQLRRELVRGAFYVPYPAKVAGKRVLLVDDVITTGNTANESARILLRAGAAEVYVITAAISPFEQEWRMH